jgi:hypothetical protein
MISYDLNKQMEQVQLFATSFQEIKRHLCSVCEKIELLNE